MKTVKGMRDLAGKEFAIQSIVVDKLKECFRLFGATPLDTPIAELKSLLEGRYGDDAKLVYELKDQGGELCCLRYDLTLPLMRYLAANNIQNLRRYQIGKVYRRDQPSFVNGRYREFLQADFDIVGVLPPMTAEVEILALLCMCFECLKIDGFKIIINDRRILDHFLKLYDVPSSLSDTVLSSIDKTTKIGAAGVREELIVKGLHEPQAKSLLQALLHSGALSDMIKYIPDPDITRLYENLARHLSQIGLLKHVTLDFGLARGLTYYTGMLYEVVTENFQSSLAGGGMYDAGLKSGSALPAVGFSIGIDRVCASFLSTLRNLPIPENTMVGIAGIAPRERYGDILSLAKRLRDSGIPTLYYCDPPLSLSKQLRKYSSDAVDIILVLGLEEENDGRIQLKNMRNHTTLWLSHDNLIFELKNVLLTSTIQNAVDL